MFNEILSEKLQHLNEDRLMLEAIKFIFNERIEKEKPNIDKGDNNAILGEKYRSYVKAKELLEAVLLDIDSYKNEKVGLEKFNKGK